MKVFLGGTCNGSTWRDELIPLLNCEYFNPVVEDWTPECQVEEIRQRNECDVCLYVISKEMIGVYSIAEVKYDSNKSPNKTMLCILLDGFNEAQQKSLKAVANLVRNNGATVAESLDDTARILNNWEVA